MRPKTLFYLFLLTFLIGATVLNNSEALCQVVRTVPAPLPPVAFPPFTYPQSQPTISTVPSVTTAPSLSTPQVSVPTAVTATTPPSHTVETAVPDAEAVTPTPTPEIISTATPVQFSTPTPPSSTQSDYYMNPSPSPTATLTPPTDDSTSEPVSASVWLWRIAPIGAVLFIIWALLRRSRRD